MTGLILPRRRLLAGLVGLVAAPTIVRAASIMAVRPLKPDFERVARIGWSDRATGSYEIWLIRRPDTGLTDLMFERVA